MCFKYIHGLLSDFRENKFKYVHFLRLVRHSNESKNIYMQNISNVDAMHAIKCKEDVHGIKDMLGSIDCTHFGCKFCPVAQKIFYR